jgi:hypothetical protein
MKWILLFLLPSILFGQLENFNSFDGINEWTSPGGNTGSHSGFLCINLTGNYLDNNTYIFESPTQCIEDYEFQITLDVRNNKDVVYIEAYDGLWNTLHAYTSFGTGVISGNFAATKMRVRIETGAGGNTNGKYVHMDYFNTSCTPLYVELIDFECNNNELKWIVNEVYTDKYIVKRNGTIIAEIKAHNEQSIEEYTYTDLNYDTSNFYEVIEVDPDGVETTLKTCYFETIENTQIEYYDLLGRRVINPKGLVIKKTIKGNKTQIEKIFVN